MSDSDDKTKVPIKVWVGGTLGAALFITALIWGPWWIEGHRLKDNKGELVSSAGIIVTGFRTMIVAIVAGVFTALGLWYTRKKHELDQRQFEHAQQQFATTLREAQQRDEQQAELTREGQVTGRYVEAIKLLASEKLYERLGGIYSLERIMKDSEKDYETVVEVLAAFIRHAPQEEDTGQPGYRIKDDTQAALSVLSRRPERTERLRINLSGANLHNAAMEGARLRHVDFTHADLTHARADGASLDGAMFVDADLTHMHLRGASLQNVDFFGSTLTQTKFDRADLRKSGFLTAKLVRASFAATNLIGARFLTVDMLLKCNINERTELSKHLADDPRIQERRG
ncbi:pentapeptide repeat-containing protein [Streptomyces mirabilis]|uniref:pentapeptide repeat-containing protein n=1 Tax=Streptomyces mirabilis TaxID=68239 RepID=UPI0036794A01